VSFLHMLSETISILFDIAPSVQTKTLKLKNYE
jgi:hypothetical protein